MIGHNPPLHQTNLGLLGRFGSSADSPDPLVAEHRSGSPPAGPFISQIVERRSRHISPLIPITETNPSAVRLVPSAQPAQPAQPQAQAQNASDRKPSRKPRTPEARSRKNELARDYRRKRTSKQRSEDNEKVRESYARRKLARTVADTEFAPTGPKRVLTEAQKERYKQKQQRRLAERDEEKRARDRVANTEQKRRSKAARTQQQQEDFLAKQRERLQSLPKDERLRRQETHRIDSAKHRAKLRAGRMER